MSRYLPLVAPLVLVTATATAQPTTEDGIRAAIRGDYHAAIRILTPLGEKATEPDPVAQFFLAILYETGHGVERNSSRACGLFLSAATPANPFMQQSSALLNLLRDDFGPLASRLCVGGSRWRNVPPVTFTLGADHRIVIAAAPQLVSAQADTADGVAALARGDYPRAAAILKPIAESVWRDDTAAQFFMATMYESGLGVPADRVRACALYHRASINTGSPFGAHAERLMRASVLSHGFEWFEDCQLLANVGFDHAFEPVTFDLAPGHWTSWDLKGATVTYDGKSKQVPMQLASRGAVFLPLRHTELTTGSPRSIARHFVEVFLWQPAAVHLWSLEWHLFEIVRGDVVRIDVSSGPLTTVPGEAPPSVHSFDVGAFATVRVTSDGNAEWSILKGPNAVTQGIESDAERRETAERALARNEALKRVDWTDEYDVTRSPSMAYEDAEGCDAIQVYGWTADRAEAIVMRVDRRVIALSEGPATFDLAMSSPGLQVEIHVFARAKRDFPYCTDVINSPAPGEGRLDDTWRAMAGTITIQLSPPGIRARAPSLYRATLTLTNAVFANASGATVRQTRPITLTAVVGFWFG